MNEILILSGLQQDDQIGNTDTEHTAQICPVDLKKSFPTEESFKRQQIF